MNKKYLTGVGIATFAVGGLLGLIRGYQPTRKNEPTHVYRLDADCSTSGKDTDDFVVRYKDGSTELYLRNSEGNYVNAEDCRKRKLSELGSQYNQKFSDLEKKHKEALSWLEKNLGVIRAKLNGEEDKSQEDKPVTPTGGIR